MISRYKTNGNVDLSFLKKWQESQKQLYEGRYDELSPTFRRFPIKRDEILYKVFSKPKSKDDAWIKRVADTAYFYQYVLAEKTIDDRVRLIIIRNGALYRTERLPVLWGLFKKQDVYRWLREYKIEE